jgi:hypothetical protein
MSAASAVSVGGECHARSRRTKEGFIAFGWQIYAIRSADYLTVSARPWKSFV